MSAIPQTPITDAATAAAAADVVSASTNIYPDCNAVQKVSNPSLKDVAEKKLDELRSKPMLTVEDLHQISELETAVEHPEIRNERLWTAAVDRAASTLNKTNDISIQTLSLKPLKFKMFSKDRSTFEAVCKETLAHPPLGIAMVPEWVFEQRDESTVADKHIKLDKDAHKKPESASTVLHSMMDHKTFPKTTQSTITALSPPTNSIGDKQRKEWKTRRAGFLRLLDMSTSALHDLIVGDDMERKCVILSHVLKRTLHKHNYPYDQILEDLNSKSTSFATEAIGQKIVNDVLQTIKFDIDQCNSAITAINHLLESPS